MQQDIQVPNYISLQLMIIVICELQTLCLTIVTYIHACMVCMYMVKTVNHTIKIKDMRVWDKFEQRILKTEKRSTHYIQ